MTPENDEPRVLIFEMDAIVSVQEEHQNEEQFFRVVPNPSSGDVHLIGLNSFHPQRLRLYNHSRQLIFTRNVDNHKGELSIPSQYLSPGLNFIQLISDRGVVVTRSMLIINK